MLTARVRLARGISPRLLLIFSVASFWARGATGRSCLANDGPAKSLPTDRVAAAAVLFANSTDGMAFVRLDQPRFAPATGPSMVCNGKHGILLVFEGPAPAGVAGGSGLVMVSSSDDGKSWSAPRVVEIDDLEVRSLRLSGPALLAVPGGGIRMAFAVRDGKGRSSLFAASYQDDGHFQKIREMHLGSPKPSVADPTLYLVGNRVHLLADNLDKRKRRFHGISGGMGRFRPQAGVSIAGIGRQGNVLRLSEGYRLYATGAGGVVSAFSKDGERWRAEEGVRLDLAADPAVVTLEDGTFLMAYVQSVSSGFSGDPSAADESMPRLADARANGEPTPGKAGSNSAAAQGPEPSVSAEDLSSEKIVSRGDDLADPAGAPQEVEPRFNDEDTDAPILDGPQPRFALGTVPVPDFQHPVDYRAWLEARYDASKAANNAFDIYAQLLSEGQGPDSGEPVWANWTNIYTDISLTGPPGPWDPSRHPATEASRLAAESMLTRYAAAADLPNYFRRIAYADNAENDLLINVILPDLGMHRVFLKQTLSDAWRVENGRVNPDVMLQAFHTGLASAIQVEQGETLIESLVGSAEKGLVRQSAIRALKHEVFDRSQMEATLDMLRRDDRPALGSDHWIVGETAFALDVTQYVFGPIEPGGEPVLNQQRYQEVAYFWSRDGDEAVPKGPVDPVETTKRIVDFYEKASQLSRKPYYEARSEIEALEREAVKDDPISRGILPSVSRYYLLQTRGEAVRRATQLSYAIHLERARTGQWPASLNALSTPDMQELRTDPFNGKDFVYKLTTDGPVLYSTSENGLDDGGVHSPQWGGHPGHELQSDDYIFWPPQD